MLQGIIFDLDGTLVDSRLDFDQIRSEMNLRPGTSILEALRTMDQAEVARCGQILSRHEDEGARRATPLPGVNVLLRRLASQGVRCGIVTRNSRSAALVMLERLEYPFKWVYTRDDDGPVKPDPWAILQICEAWGVSPASTAMIGDYRFDIEAGRRAGTKTVFFTRGQDPSGLEGAEHADLLLASFLESDALLMLQ